MNETDIEDQPDLNSGTPWSEMDLFDLANGLRLKDPIEEIASFLCPSRREVPEEVAELKAIERIRTEMAGVTIEALEYDWRKRWPVERGVEIISESSRRLTDGLRLRHPEIPWAKVAGIGNVLRHADEGFAEDSAWLTQKTIIVY